MRTNLTATSLGEKIRSLREQASLSLREVGTKIGIDTSLLAKIERSERHPTKDQLKLFAKYFRIDEKEIIKEYLSDQIAYKILEEDVDIDTLKVAEKKVQYLKTKQ